MPVTPAPEPGLYPGRTIAVDGTSNAGKTTLIARLARARGFQVLPDAGDLVTVFPPPPDSPEAARANERYCLLVEEARAALLRTGWRESGDCLLDRSALSTLAISYGYAPVHGHAVFDDLCAAMADSVRAGRLVLPDFYCYLRAEPDVVRARNTARPEPLRTYWLQPRLIARQLRFYDTWMALLPRSAGVTIDASRTPAAVLAQAIRFVERVIGGVVDSGAGTTRPVEVEPVDGAALLDELRVRLSSSDRRPGNGPGRAHPHPGTDEGGPAEGVDQGGAAEGVNQGRAAGRGLQGGPEGVDQGGPAPGVDQ